MKEDAPAPAHPPTKRRALERAPDLWLAVWASDESLPEADRKRVQAIRDARKVATPDRILGLILDKEGATPQQLLTIKEILPARRPTAIHHVWCAARIHSACEALKVPVTVHARNGFRDVVLATSILVALPRGQETDSPVWDAIKYANHRKSEVTVVLPSGETA